MKIPATLRSRLAIALLVVFIAPLVLEVLPAFSGAGPCSIFRSWSTGDSLTASDLTSSFTQIGVTNANAECQDDHSSSLTEMQAVTSPFTTAASQPTTGAGEIERLRYMWSHVMGYTSVGGFWYDHWRDLALRDRAVNNHLSVMTAWRQPFGGWTGLDNAATRFHLMGIGLYTANAHPESLFLLYHVNGTTRFSVGIGGDVHVGASLGVAPGTARFPTVWAHRYHGTGLWFPQDNQLAVTVGGDSPYRFHATGLATHALLFQHAASGNYTAFVAHALSTVTRTYRLPQAFGTQGQVLAMGPNAGGFADLEWTNTGGSAFADGTASAPSVSGSGTGQADTGIFWVQQDHLGVTVGGLAPYRFHATGFATHSVLFMHAASGNYTGFQVHASATRVLYQLPAAPGTTGQVLATRTAAGGQADLEWTNTGATTSPWTTMGSNNTEQTTTSATDVDLVTITTTSIATNRPIDIRLNFRKAAGGTNTQLFLGLKLNATTVLATSAVTNTNASAVNGIMWIHIMPVGSTNYTNAGVARSVGSDNLASQTSGLSSLPNAAITTVVITAKISEAFTAAVKDVLVLAGPAI